jgi:phosphatidylinositol alpha 1,6-mannosyltransferase
MRHGDHVRVAIITESFLPSINRVTTTVLRVLDHLQQSGHPALVVAPGEGTTEHRGTPVVRVPAVDLPRQLSIPVGVPWPGMFRTVARFDPDVVHLAAPFVVGAHGLAVARRLEMPSVAVYQTDLAGFTAAYGMGLTSAAAWRWTCRLHQRADRTLAPLYCDRRGTRSPRGSPGLPLGSGVDTEHFCPQRRDVALHRKLTPSGELLMGYARRLSAACRAAGSHRGHGADTTRRRRRWATPGRAATVASARLFTSGCSAATPRHGLRHARRLVHTGPYETFCQTVQEAMAPGTPVIAPDAGGPPDLVAPALAEIICPERGRAVADRAESFASGVRELLAVPWPSCAAARRCAEQFTWSAAVDGMLAALRAS